MGGASKVFTATRLAEGGGVVRTLVVRTARLLVGTSAWHV